MKFLFGIPWLIYGTAFAATPAATSQSGLLNSVQNQFIASLSSINLSGFVTGLFWALAGIALLWQLIQMMFSRGELGDMIAQVVRWMLFTFTAWAFVAPNAFFWSLMGNAVFTDAMVAFFNGVSGSLGQMTPSGIVDTGWAIVRRATDAINWNGFDPLSSTPLAYSVMSLANWVISLAVFVLMLSVALEFLIMVISIYVLIYVGVVCLGFAGSSWTKDFAFGYFKAIFMSALQVLGLVIIVKLATDQFLLLYAEMDRLSVAVLTEYGQWMCKAIILGLAMKMLASRVPQMLAGILSGNFSYSTGGALGGAVAMAASAASLAGAGAALAAAGTVQGTKNLGRGINALAEGGKAVADAGSGQGTLQSLANFGRGAAQGWSEFSQAANQGGEATPGNSSTHAVNAALGNGGNSAGSGSVSIEDAGASPSTASNSSEPSSPASSSGGSASGSAASMTTSANAPAENGGAGSSASDGSMTVNPRQTQGNPQDSKVGSSAGNASLGGIPDAVNQSFAEAAGLVPEGATIKAEANTTSPAISTATSTNNTGVVEGASNTQGKSAIVDSRSTSADANSAASMDLKSLAGMIGRGAYRAAKGTGKGLFKGSEAAEKFIPGRKTAFYSGGVLMGNVINLKNFTGLG